MLQAPTSPLPLRATLFHFYLSMFNAVDFKAFIVDVSSQDLLYVLSKVVTTFIGENFKLPSKVL
ncbi:hypothetical protein HanIR_Chr11g0559521 [Helianthus annuus]|nr:hypothetical protein HanIR_Chr11g0559521 [Helianthus annuus]